MRSARLLGLVVALVLGAACRPEAPPVRADTTADGGASSAASAVLVRGPVVVELFSSEGCSSCPPAEALLRELEEDPGIVALEQHVDYWDDLGWADPFARATFGERQRAAAGRLGLDRVYTPQAIVDGRRDVVGSDRKGLLAAIAAARDARPAQNVVALSRSGADLVVAIDRVGGTADARLYATERGLSSRVTRGENRGRTLSHAAVVRSVDDLGEVRDGTRLTVARPATAKVRHVLVVADRKSGAVVASAVAD